MSPSLATGIPVLHYRTGGRPPAQAFDEWRQLMAPMYDTAPAGRTGRLPGGGVSAYLLGDILANRTVFTAQHVTRDRRRAANTPDHVVLQYWRTGGSSGQVGGRDCRHRPGRIAIADRRYGVDALIAPSDTFGIVFPRSLLAGIDLDGLGFHLDPARNRLMAARILALHRRLPHLRAQEVPELTAELLAFLRRRLDRSQAIDVLEGAELDAGLLGLAEQVMLSEFARPGLSPQAIADTLRVSRATLYRAFEPLGGVMRHLQEQRLLALRDALADPLEMRPLNQLAAAHGFGSPSLLSRSFRSRFGASPRAWRSEHQRRSGLQAVPDPARLWWNTLGRRA